ncbi:MAG: cupin domain-containing protein [Sinobacteraceae bacterium]|nr:cupin domain-containing protein [Nevskiaceae bacterium]
MSPEETDTLDDAAVQALGEALTPAEFSAKRRASMRTRIMSRLKEAAPPLTETIRTESIPWRAISPNVQAKVLKRDDAAGVIFVLWQLEPGGVVSGHPHDEEQDEECLVLQGDMLVGTHCVRAGELHIAKRGSAHADLTTRTGCLIMVRSGISPLLARLFAA